MRSPDQLVRPVSRDEDVDIAVFADLCRIGIPIGKNVGFVSAEDATEQGLRTFGGLGCDLEKSFSSARFVPEVATLMLRRSQNRE